MMLMSTASAGETLVVATGVSHAIVKLLDAHAVDGLLAKLKLRPVPDVWLARAAVAAGLAAAICDALSSGDTWSVAVQAAVLGVLGGSLGTAAHLSGRAPGGAS
jgi:hypothetical protein